MACFTLDSLSQQTVSPLSKTLMLTNLHSAFVSAIPSKRDTTAAGLVVFSSLSSFWLTSRAVPVLTHVSNPLFDDGPEPINRHAIGIEDGLAQQFADVRGLFAVRFNVGKRVDKRTLPGHQHVLPRPTLQCQDLGQPVLHRGGRGDGLPSRQHQLAPRQFPDAPCLGNRVVVSGNRPLERHLEHVTSTQRQELLHLLVPVPLVILGRLE